MNIQFNPLPSCPICKEGVLLPLSEVFHHTARESGFFENSVSTSSASKTFANWKCSVCGHFASKAHSGSFYQGGIGVVDWSKTCCCVFCKKSLKDRNEKEKLGLENL